MLDTYPHDLAGDVADAPVNPEAGPELFAARLQRDLAAFEAGPLPVFGAGGPRLCGALTVFRAEANTANPGRDKSSDGWIGDAAHQLTNSLHNPDRWNVVRAVDRDVDGLDLAGAFERLRAKIAAGGLPAYTGGHLILNGRITAPDFRSWRVYTGKNPHRTHGHAASTTDPARYDDRTPTGVFIVGQLPAPAPAPADGRTLRRGSTGDAVKRLQTRLRTGFPLYAKHIASDGVYGAKTEAAVAEFQRRSRLKVDGIAGPVTLGALGL